MNLWMLLFCLTPNGLSSDIVWERSTGHLDLSTRYQDYLSLDMTAASPDGTVVVLDFSERQLVYVNPDGTPGKRVGKPGQGPREFAGFEAIRWSAEHKGFAVIDRSNLRLTIWDTKAELIHSEILSDILRKPQMMSKQKIVFLKGHDMHLGAEPELHLYNTKSGKSVELWKMDPITEQSGYHKRTSHGFDSFAVDFNATVHFAVSGNVALVNYGVSPELLVVDLESGKLIRKVHAEVPAVPMTDAYYSYIYDNMAAIDQRDVDEKIGRPDFWPYFSRLMVAPNGNFWLFSYQNTPNGSGNYLVIDKSGKTIERGSVPGGAVALTKNAIFVVRCDAKGEKIHLAKVAR